MEQEALLLAAVTSQLTIQTGVSLLAMEWKPSFQQVFHDSLAKSGD